MFKFDTDAGDFSQEFCTCKCF